jgi:amidophosphoribosyltransferase
VFGIVVRQGAVAATTVAGLHALQHRGQESAGIAAAAGQRITLHKGMGLVGDVFDEDAIQALPGHTAIGHTRYATTGASQLANAQPLLLQRGRDAFALCHNGNLTNAASLRAALVHAGARLTTTSDTEVAGLVLAPAPGATWAEALAHLVERVEGAYCLLILTTSALYAVRDPWGIRPLCLGRLDDGGWVVASESAALAAVGATLVREVAPGEALRIDADGVEQLFHRPARRGAFCLFEYIYFARPDSMFGSQSVYSVRLALGRQLAAEAPASADLVIGVPDSAIPAALGYAQASGLPYGEAFVRQRYTGRTFIQPAQRQQAVARKLAVLPDRLQGRRVVLVDDSIVRGTTTRQLVPMLRAAGAREVHLRVAAPPIKHPCAMGVDMATYAELIAHRLAPDDLAAYLGADSLAYLSYAALLRASGLDHNSACGACFTGRYPLPIETAPRVEQPVSSQCVAPIRLS